MSFEVEFTLEAIKDLERHKKSGDKILLTKLNKLLDELEEHPEIGTGKPEKLKYQFSGKWSRRIDRKHRLVYSIDYENSTVEILSAYGHYE
jgi:toxin YoeB